MQKFSEPSGEVAIRVDGLWKEFHLGGADQLCRTFRETLVGAAAYPFRYAAGLLGIRQQTAASEPDSGLFWALADTSLEIRTGEVFGIIGRNGAGKSTLLKILARIIEPTRGYADLYGRIGSLLEVGVGFHNELTGRENIFLNGAILGMRKAETLRKFDEIVGFAGVEKFLDTQVKHYSSGMYMRLAFAVAAHLDTQILLVDEVLAVGDAKFQKKCLGKIGEVARDGRAIVFVSHNMDAIRRICTRTGWLDKGRFRSSGPTSHTIAEYLLSGIQTEGAVAFDEPRTLHRKLPVVAHSLQISTDSGDVITHFSTRSSIRVRIEWEVLDRLYKPRIGVVISTSDGVEVLTALDANAWAVGWVNAGRRISTCVIPGGLLNEGEYMVSLAADAPYENDFDEAVTEAFIRFDVEDDLSLPNKNYGQEGFSDRRWPGVLLLNLPWVQEEA